MEKQINNRILGRKQNMDTARVDEATCHSTSHDLAPVITHWDWKIIFRLWENKYINALLWLNTHTHTFIWWQFYHLYFPENLQFRIPILLLILVICVFIWCIPFGVAHRSVWPTLNLNKALTLIICQLNARIILSIYRLTEV